MSARGNGRNSMAGLSILACQVDVSVTTTVAERDRHLDRVAEAIRIRLQRRRHDLVVLPELSSIDYSKASFDNLHLLAEPLDGPSFHRFDPLAREFGATIVYGMPRRGVDGYYISQVAADGRGEPIGHFDKLHLAQFGASMEKDYFNRGDHLFVFEHRGVTIAPIICYDIRMPELTRTLAIDHGAHWCCTAAPMPVTSPSTVGITSRYAEPSKIRFTSSA